MKWTIKKSNLEYGGEGEEDGDHGDGGEAESPTQVILYAVTGDLQGKTRTPQRRSPQNQLQLRRSLTSGARNRAGN